MLPITGKLNPFAIRRNFAYLAEAAVLTRLTTGLVRVWENKPSNFDDPQLNMNQKRQAFWERAFVEMIGTTGTIGMLHLGQDIFSKALESGEKAKIPVLTDLPGLSGTPAERAAMLEKANQGILEVYGVNSHGLLYRIMYGKQVRVNGVTQVKKANLTELRKVLGSELFEQVRPELRDFVMRMNRRASTTVLGGVALSALFGGVVIQWINDRLVSPLIEKSLCRKFPADGATGGAQKKDAETPAVPTPGLPIRAQLPMGGVLNQPAMLPGQVQAAFHAFPLTGSKPPPAGFGQQRPQLTAPATATISRSS